MLDKTEILKIKIARQKILRALNMLYETPVPLKSIWHAVCHISYDESLFAKDITYFFDKGWIEFIDDKIGGANKFMDKVVKLTAKGKEIAEGTDIDKALEI